MHSGVWGVGLATRNTDLNVAPGGRDAESWVLCHDSVQRHNNIEIERVSNNPVEGDILVSFKPFKLKSLVVFKFIVVDSTLQTRFSGLFHHISENKTTQDFGRLKNSSH